MAKEFKRSEEKHDAAWTHFERNDAKANNMKQQPMGNNTKPEKEKKNEGTTEKQTRVGKKIGKKDIAEKMGEGIHRVGSNPSRFVHKSGGKGNMDLYETWKGGKQSIKPTK